MQIATNKLGLLLAEIDSEGSLRLSGDRVLFGAKRSQSETEWLVRQKVAQCRQAIAETVHSFGGVVVQTLGDRVLCNLADANRAVLAGCAIQQTQKRTANGSDQTPVTTQLGIRVAIHYDKLMVDAGKLSGRSMTLLYALLSAVDSDQVIATEEAITSLRPELRALAKAMAPLKLLDDEGPVGVMEMNWKAVPSTTASTSAGNSGDGTIPPNTTDRLMLPQQYRSARSGHEDDGTENEPSEEGSTTAQFARRDLLEQLRASANEAEQVVAATRLELKYKDKQIMLDAAHPTITLRSGPDRVQHAKISLQDVGFVLENLHPLGTRVRISDRDDELCETTVFLEDRGAIALDAVASEGEQLIHFTVHG